MFSLITQNPIMGMHKHVHLKATYRLRVDQFITQQVGKEVKGKKFIHPILGSLIPRLPPSFSSLTVQKNRRRPGIIYHMSNVRVERRVERTQLNMG